MWAQHYNGAANAADTATAIMLHNDTTLVVTGTSYNGSNFDYYTIKYDTTGTLLWQIAYNGADNLNDMAHALAIDSAGAIIVTGQSQTMSGLNYTTVKYIELDPYFPPDFNSEDPGILDFIQNKGQVLDTSMQQVASIRYYNQNVYPNVFIHDSKCSFLFHAIDTLPNNADTLHRIDMRFVGSNTQTKSYAFEPNSPYYNYYLPPIPNGAVNVKGYKRLFVPDIYPLIDLHYYSNAHGIKMYFVVKAGGRPQDIVFALDSAVSTAINGNGTLSINSLLETLVLDEPEFYQDSLSIIIPRSGGAYQSTANPDEYEFTIPAYNPGLPLIIQIDRGNGSAMGGAAIDNIEWSTYVGGTLYDAYNRIRPDKNQNILACGYSQTANFPVTSGAIIDQNLSNLNLAVFSKFDRSNGELLYSTYIGGTTIHCGNNLTNVALDIAADTSDNIYVVGSTNSSNFSPNAQNTVGGSILQSANNSNTGSCTDLFIASFIPDGTQVRFSTYYGGASYENADAIFVDKNNRILIGGSTASTNFPVSTATPYTGGYHSTSYGEGFIMEILPNGDTTWVSYFPGRVLDFIVDDNNQLYFTGNVFSTYASNIPIHNPSPGNSFVDSSFNGSWDAYIVCLDTDRIPVWSTFMGGSNGDYGHALAYHDGEIALTGITGSNNFKPLKWQLGQYIDSVYGVNFAVTGPDIFISKFATANKQVNWSTYYGGNAPDYAYGAAFDKNHNLYITGYTTSFPVPHPNAFELQNYTGAFYDNTMAGSEGFILGFNASNQRFWATYLGGDGGGFSDGGFGVFATTYDQLFVGGSTSSTFNFPLVKWNSVCWYDSLLNDTNNGSAEDGFISMFDISNYPIVSVQEEITQNLGIGLFPNPNNGNFNLVFSTAYNKPVAIRVFNNLGQCVYQKSLNQVDAGSIIQISAEDLASGLYVLRLDSEKQMQTTKFIISK